MPNKAKNAVTRVKVNTKRYAPVIGAAVGAAVTAAFFHRMYNPKDKVAIQMPGYALRKMVDEGKGLILNTDKGLFTLNYVPNNPTE